MYHNKKILLVDDEAGLLDMLKITLNKERFNDITCAYNAKEALELVKSTNFDLLVLDVMLPDLSGFELCSQIRQFSFAPIIFLTACAGDLDIVTGLAMGGDDYITKPFNPLEVTARIKAILRRQTQYAEKSTKVNLFDYGSFQVNLDNATLILDGNLVECTAKEFELLCFFCKHPNYVFTSTQIYEAVWDVLGYGDEKTVTIHISKLRKKLGDDTKNPSIILNLRGLGYKFVPPKKE
ncbi:MAG: response regulator transcription factor [Anaerovorax sp.]|nr:response regulator transcription factor [Anaerovorax sp.]